MSSNTMKPVSNIAAAFAAQQGHYNNPKTPMLPTPPNSISPTLPPHKVRSVSASSSHPPPHVDSDIDLEEAVAHEASQGHPQALSSAALSGVEAAGQITAAMLARDYIPAALLGQEEALAIRFILAHLTAVLPGFSKLPAAKARRIVVAALESPNGGGPNGDVQFVKTGWGRWTAHRRSEGSAPTPGSNPMPPAFNSTGLQIPKGARPNNVTRRDIYSGASWNDSVMSAPDEDMDDVDMAEHEADKMSLDGDQYAADAVSDNPSDATDEEDWAQQGPQALRSKWDTPQARLRNYHMLTMTLTGSMVRAGASPRAGSSVPQSTSNINGNLGRQSRSDQKSASGGSYGTGTSISNGVFVATCGSMEEKEAVEALLRMGSM
ncbi:hypothetical protein EJ06DRAFT_577416 [Trichodelitschia bisporula]|uniref:Sin3 binding protein n=1 Tax=Trichodelitschia bisporula TaxID=703511 RepID=A0A6G1HWE2_9PEZI|nr:hypothetical protein EJ06DRAFT_577416 [Trichodelitschia bisporula]